MERSIENQSERVNLLPLYIENLELGVFPPSDIATSQLVPGLAVLHLLTVGVFGAPTLGTGHEVLCAVKGDKPELHEIVNGYCELNAYCV